MVRLTRLLMVLAALGATLPVPCGLAQAPTPTPAATPAATEAAEPNPLPGLPRPPDQPASLLQGSPPGPVYACTTPESPYFERDPRLDPPPLPPPGWVVDVDVGILAPHVKNKLTDTVQIDGGPLNTVQLPSAPLDWTASPRFEAGYRLPSGFGEFTLAYRFLATDGTSGVAGPDAPALLKSRLELNMADCDYASREISLWPNWDMKWWFGIRVPTSSSTHRPRNRWPRQRPAAVSSTAGSATISGASAPIAGSSWRVGWAIPGWRGRFDPTAPPSWARPSELL